MKYGGYLRGSKTLVNFTVGADSRFCMRFVAMSLILLVLASCSLGIEEIKVATAGIVKQIISENPALKNETDIEVGEIFLLEKQSREYHGTATVNYSGQLHRVAIKVFLDGTNILVEIPPGGLASIVFQKIERDSALRSEARRLESEARRQELDRRLEEIRTRRDRALREVER